MKRDWTECQIPPPSWNEDIHDLGESEPILTAVVRKCYLNHLKCTLEQNYRCLSDVDLEGSPNVDIERFTFKLERKALQKCMIASLYQKAMLSMINNIKQCTSEHKLYASIQQDMADSPIKPEIKIPGNLNLVGNKYLMTDCKVENKVVEVTNKAPGDTVAMEQDLASESSYDWNHIEKEMARVCGLTFNGSDSDLGKMLMEDDTLTDPCASQSVNAVVPAIHSSCESYDWEALRIKHEGELKRRWEELEKTASLEKQAKIKRRIIQLFGEDELALADASSDLTEKAAAQYRERIAPWIVKHLMPLYKEKRIASRALFKKLARHIADCLIFRNRTPDECDVWMSVQEFFQHGEGIMSEADIFS